jgi:branched-chain amino acid transport system ATP-binding protein
VRLEGKSLSNLPLHAVSRAGVALVPEGRRLFPRLSVRDNLRLGSYTKRGTAERDAPLEFIFELFPRLAERLEQRAETLSGGEQQMLAVGRALMMSPRLLMLDEPSQGIMPKLVDEILRAIDRIRARGTTVLIVEQRVMECLELADRGYVLQSGRVVMSGPSAELRGDERIRKAYLGM